MKILLPMSLFLISFPPLAAEELEVGKISGDALSKVERRQRSLKLTGYGIGFQKAYHDGGDSLYSVNFLNARGASLDQDIRLEAKLYASEKARNAFFSGSIGVAHHFSRTSISPLIGGSFGLGASYGNEDRGTQFGAIAEVFVGVRAFRTSDAQLDAKLGCDQLQRKDNVEKKPTFCGMTFSALL